MIRPLYRPDGQNGDDDDSFIRALAVLTKSRSEATAVTASRPPTLHFTPPPPGGFPKTYRGLAAEFMDNLNPGTVRAWCAMPHPKFFVKFYDYDGRDSSSRHPTLVSKLQKFLGIIASHEGTLDANIKVSPPCAPPAPTTTKQIMMPTTAKQIVMPTTFLVYGISEALASAVLTQCVWSVPQVTFEAYPFEPKVIPSIMLCLAGYICPDEDTVVDSVRAAWLQPETSAQLQSILMANDENFLDKTQALSAIQTMADSVHPELLDLKAQGGGSSPRWNIHVAPPTLDIIAWTKIQEYVTVLTYPSVLHGTGTCRQLFFCALCHSFSHPRGLCPFPNIPGWNGPHHDERPSSGAPMKHASKGRGRGQAGPSMPV